jgi:hypothetical protein
MHIATYAYLQKFLGNMDIDSKTFWFRRKESILHRNMHIAHIARCNMHIAIKNRSMHIAIKKSETSSPNEQTWSNTFRSKSPWYVGGYLRVSAYAAVPERRGQRWQVARRVVVVDLVVVIAVVVVIAAVSRIRMNTEPLVQQDARPMEGHDHNPRRQAQVLPPADNNARRLTTEEPRKTAPRNGPTEMA